MKFATTDPVHAENIRLAADPKTAAEMGRDRSKQMRPDWDEVKDDVMRHAVILKLLQHKDLATKLLATGHAHLIEDAPHDSYWGTGSAKGGGGKNMLGLILEEARDVLRADLPQRRARAQAMDEAESHMEMDGYAQAILPADAYVRALVDAHGVSGLR